MLGDYLEQMLSDNIRSGRQDSVRLLPDYGQQIERIEEVLSSVRRMVSAAESDTHAAAEEGATLGDFRVLPSDVFRDIIGRAITLDAAQGYGISFNTKPVRLVCRAMRNAVNAQLRVITFRDKVHADEVHADERQTQAIFLRMGNLEEMVMDLASCPALVPSLRAAAARGGGRLAQLALSVCPESVGPYSGPQFRNAQAKFATSLAPALAQLDGLKSLSFQDINCDDDRYVYLHAATCEALAPALVALTRLETLRLDNCWCEEDDDEHDRASSLRALSPALASLVRLRSLDIGMNWLGCDRGSFGDLAPVLANMTRLTSLDLNRNAVAYVMDLLVPALWSLGNLAWLSMEHNNIDKLAALRLAPGLQRLTNLTYLDVSENEMGPDGIAALASALQNLTKLADLNLSDNTIGIGAVALAPALRRLTNLTNLDLSSNEIGLDGMLALAPALQRLTNLTKLRMHENNEGAEGRAALAPVLRCLTKLQITRWSPW